MLRQSSSRKYGSKKLRPRHSFQAFLFFAVGIWIVYQLSRSHGKRRAAVVEITDGGNAMDGGEEAARRRLGRKAFIGAFTGHASFDDDDIGGVGSDDGVGNQGAASSDDDEALSKTEDREGGSDGDEEDQAADEDDGGADDAEDGISGDEEDDDDRDLLSGNSDIEDELKTVFGERDGATVFGESDGATVFGNGDDDGARLVHEPKELTSSAVPRPKATGNVQEAAASQQGNATDGGTAADSATALGGSFLKNASSVNPSLHDSETGSVVNGFAAKVACAENERHNVSVEGNRVTNQNETADSVAGHSISG